MIISMQTHPSFDVCGYYMLWVNAKIMTHNSSMETSSLLHTFVTVICLMTGCLADYGNALLVNCKASDRETLIDFKNGLVDPKNLLSSWEGSNCCQWWGVGCNNWTGDVIVVDIHNPDKVPESCGLRGEIRSSLANLSSLEYLDLSFNAFIHNQIPIFFQSFKKLQYLNLAYAGFDGKIPPNLGNISTLQHVDISSLAFSTNLAADDIRWVTGLTALKYLAMDRVDLSMVGSNWVEAFNMLPYLSDLHLSACNLPSPPSFLNFTNFSSLAVLDLSHNFFHSFPQWLVNVSSLMYIDLSFNSIWDSIPVGFTKLPNLRFLNLGGNGLMASTYQLFEESWSKIEVIQLGFNFVQGKLPPSIGNMTSLTHLALPGNSIEGNIPNSIFKLCSLEYLDLSYNNLTGSLPEHLEGTKYYLYESPLPHLQNLVLIRTSLVGILPNWLGQLQNLVQLNLDSNFFHGSVPAAFGTLRHLAVLILKQNELNGTLPNNLGQISNLSILDVSSNRLTGTLPDILGKLSELSFLDVSSNCLTGIVSESHFAKLTKLKVLSFSWNSFIFKISPNWDPPFQVESLMLSSCRLGSFPGWLKSQRHLLDLDLSNANMSGPIPSWFWDISGNLSLLNFSSNSLWGQLPNKFKVHFNAFTDLSFNLLEGPIPLPTNQIIILNLSHNNFSGPIPENIGDLSFLSFFSLANNQISGEIPTSIGELQLASVIDLSRNTLTGSIPKSIGNCLFLEVLDLQNNNLSGKIPRSLGQLSDLQTLHLRDNMITGKLPSSFKGLWSLETLDLGYNRLIGKIPQWPGDAFPNLKVLSLRSNAFSGKIPSALLNLTSLKILDLAENQLSGSIPPGMSNLKTMTQEQNIKQDLIYGWVVGAYYEENVIVNTKGQSLEYTRTLSFLTCIDLSGNYLHGEFPHEVTKLAGLVVLNLSRNQISGQIPQSISELHQLASLDLSCNMFSGPIPSSIISMSFLEFLNMSYNNFSGRIPYAGQMSTFEASSFAGNPGLCGAPLAVECSDSGPPIPGINGEIDNGEIDNGDGYIVDKWLYLAIGLGFAAGVLIPYLLMAFKRTWSYMYFDSVDKVADALLYLGCKTSACFRNHCYHRR